MHGRNAANGIGFDQRNPFGSFILFFGAVRQTVAVSIREIRSALLSCFRSRPVKGICFDQRNQFIFFVTFPGR
ncbi:hypothetical protein EGT74_26670 [Chitinophaga lutea]|uniref:Uncharacterized protein n=1 Tax=Chitinophaga lutea TaxID=2488634 RepID=A0A3N4PHA0_9BACT|nr:hypothetical protein EGT74_26670 [Chitinophaga lutea]